VGASKWHQTTGIVSPELLISPLGVFEFTSDERRMRLRSVHAWSSLAEIRARTGFDLAVEDRVPVTAGRTRGR
jgi:acyl CoA:acetate/3-ketoacid CoA transferase beta subunit